MNSYPVQDLFNPQMLPDRHSEPCSRLIQLSWRTDAPFTPAVRGIFLTAMKENSIWQCLLH